MIHKESSIKNQAANHTCRQEVIPIDDIPNAGEEKEKLLWQPQPVPQQPLLLKKSAEDTEVNPDTKARM